MGFGRAVSAAITAAAVCGCAVLALDMAHATPDTGKVAQREPLPTYSYTRTAPAYRVLTPAPRTSASPSTAPTSAAAPSTSAVPMTSAPSSTAPRTSPAPAPSHRTTHAAPTSAPPTTSHAPVRHSVAPAPAPKPKPKPKPLKSGVSLPLPNFYTGSATRVVTVVAAHTYSTTATLQAWDKAPGWGWLKHGPAITAHIGSEGMTSSPSESKSATPIGSFSLTRAFGKYSDPGTPLPYLQTNSSDWWISQSGPLYNTLQRCSSHCAFHQGSPNEHLYYETPYYNYAVVIDYNTRNVGTVRQGAGSAFFLHVSVGTATAGCVAVPQSYLVALMHWLSPSAHPRILMGAP